MAHSFQVHFDGIICHADRTEGSPSQGKRAIFPDARSHGAHIIYVEFLANDFSRIANPSLNPIPYTRLGRNLARLEFQNVRFDIPNISSPAGVIPKTNYKFRVPRLKELVPNYGDVKHRTGVPAVAIGAYFDYDRGELDGGTAEQMHTSFEKLPSWTPRQVPEWVQPDLGLSSDTPVIQISDLATGQVTSLTLRQGAASVTFGNQTIHDIQGVLPSGPHPNHFSAYYELVPETRVVDGPLPRRTFGLGTGCTNTNWP